MKVILCTNVQNAAAFKPATLTFKTIRTGFPTWPIEVFDNGSQEFFTPIADLADSIDARFFPLRERIPYHDFIAREVRCNIQGIVFVDTDIIFYGSLEHLITNGPLAGRVLPWFYNDYVEAYQVPTIETAVLWIPDPPSLQLAIEKANFDPVLCPFDPWTPRIGYLPDKTPIFWDVGANLYNHLGGYAFPETVVSQYAHIRCGSILDKVVPRMRVGEKLLSLHRQAQEDPKSLRDLWLRQKRYYNEMGK
jgi:hypothetical protein